MDYSTYGSTEMMFDMMGFGLPPDAPVPLADADLAGTTFRAPLMLLADGLGADRAGSPTGVRPALSLVTVAAGTIEAGTVSACSASPTRPWSAAARPSPSSTSPAWAPGRRPTGRPAGAGGSPSRDALDGARRLHRGERRGRHRPGCLGTAMHAVHAIAPACAAEPGIRTFLDLPTISAAGGGPRVSERQIEHPSRFAAEAPDRTAVVVGGTGGVLTYLRARGAVVPWPTCLRTFGLGPGGHVAVLLENRTRVLRGGGCAAQRPVRPPDQLAPRFRRGRLHRRGPRRHRPRGLGRARRRGGEARATAGPWRAGWRSGATSPASGLRGGARCPAGVAPAGRVRGQLDVLLVGTGRPKGVKPRRSAALGAGSSFSMLVQGLYGGGEDSVYLSPALLYRHRPGGPRRSTASGPPPSSWSASTRSRSWR